ncbi:MAG: hypothetical protein GXY08_11055 [Ruminococcus sp.]|nr:hypothetical protein [Ruminococcus sp.]
MKDYKEVAESVFRMRDRYLEDKKRKKALVIKRMSVALSCCIVLLVGYGIWNSEILRSVMPDKNENSDTHMINEEPETGNTDIIVTTTDGSAEYVVTTLTSAAPPDEVGTTAAVTDIPETETTSAQAGDDITTTTAEEDRTAVTTTSGGIHRPTRTTTTAGSTSHHIRTTTVQTSPVRTTATRIVQTTRTGTAVTTFMPPPQTNVTHTTQTNAPRRTTTTAQIVTTHRTTPITTTTFYEPVLPPDTTTSPWLGTTTSTKAMAMYTTTTMGTAPPKYITHMVLDGYDYYNREDSTLNLNKIGAKIGNGTAYGYDEEVDDVTSVPVHIYRARNMSEDYAVMVKYQDSDEFFYFVNNEYFPDTVGDLIDDTGMRYNGSTEFVYSRATGDLLFEDVIDQFVDILEQYRDLPVKLLKQEEEFGVDYSVYGAIQVNIYGCKTYTFDLNDEGYIQFGKHYYYDDEGDYVVPSIYVGPEAVKSITDRIYSLAGGG